MRLENQLKNKKSNRLIGLTKKGGAVAGFNREYSKLAINYSNSQR